MIVAADGSGDFSTLQAALDAALAISGPLTIHVRPGVYREKLRVDRPNLRLLGTDAGSTVLSWDDHATKTYADGTPYGTFASSTLLVEAPDFVAENLTIENTAGPGELVGQAVAAYVDGDRAVFRRCRFLGHQDTLFTGPLPPRPLTVATFGGPREGAPRTPTRQYYRDCYFEGDVDFVFGSATAVFQNCQFHSLDRSQAVNGWVTAASTPEGQKHGYVLFDCHLTGEAADGSVYLGRPWRDFAQTVLVRCQLGPHIHPEGWHDWDKPSARLTAVYAEVDCTGPGARGTRPAWVKRSGELEAAALSPAAVLAGTDGWNPEDR